MIDQWTLERAAERFQPPEESFERLVLRRSRKQRNRRIATGVLAVVLALGSFVGLVRAFRTAEPRVGGDTKPDIFADVHGWIAYGGHDGIWALDPDRPDDRGARIQLSVLPGEPIAWSSDGSTLLVIQATSFGGTLVDVSSYRPGGHLCLSVLHADGTEDRVVTFDPDQHPLISGFSLSSDGAQVVFVEHAADSDVEALYVADVEDGSRRLVRNTSMEPLVIADLGWRGMLLWPAFSPDGTQIAYFHGGGDHSEDLKIMDAEGTNARSLFGDRRLEAHVQGLAWSPDGSQLAFAADDPEGIWGIWTIGADGSGYRLIARGEDPSWSPDGSRIAFLRGRTLYSVDADGSDLREVGEVSGDAIAWNPVG